MTSVYKYLWRRAWVTSLRWKRRVHNASLRCPIVGYSLCLFAIMVLTLGGGLVRTP